MSSEMEYEIQVPSFRLQDIHCLEDIVEEVARMKGYDTFPRTLPQRLMSCVSSGEQTITRMVKRHLAYAARMQELVSYPFYDEQWLRTLGLTDIATLEVKNPVSDHLKRLVTSLIPNLLKALVQNAVEEAELGFFEINKVWIPTDNTTYHEENTLALLLYTRKRVLDFYEMKQVITSLLEMLQLSLTWKSAHADVPWYLPQESAQLFYGERRVGTVGRITPSLLEQCAEGIAYAAELDMTFITQYKAPAFAYRPVSKFQPVRWDISLLAPNNLTVEHIQKSIRAVDSRITQVMLKDMFEKPEWKQRRSLTFHIIAIDHTHTLTGSEIDDLMNRVTATIQQNGGEMR